MTTLLTYLPFLLSFVVGMLLIEILFFSKKEPFLLKFFLSCGLGLGLSGQLTFLSFLLYNQYNKIFILILHFLVIFILSFFLAKKYKSANASFQWIPTLTREEIAAIVIIGILSWPILNQALMYPHGGWDAWSVWNFKAKMLFLGGENWRNIFDSALWRTSPHYPLLLPCINAWGWSLINATPPAIPIATSIIFTLMTSGLVFAFLNKLKMKLSALLSLIALLSLPIFIKFATSQYADIIVGFYLLSALGCLILSKIDKNPKLAILSALFLGCLSFTKNEGLLATWIIIALSFYHFLLPKNQMPFKKYLGPFLLMTFVSLIIPLIFTLFFAPDNQTKINGLTSTTNPSTLKRLQFIFAYYGMEIINGKWTGLLVIIGTALLFNAKNAFRNHGLIIALTLAGYMGMITAYYFVNTKWEILWWLSVSLTRIVVSLLPTLLFWAISSFYSSQTKES